MKTTTLIVCFLLLLAMESNGQGFIVTYPQEPNAVLSTNYTVFVNEIPITVYNIGDNRDVAYTHFAFAGKITVRIHVSNAVTKFNLSPHGYNIVATKSGQDISFELDKPRNFLLKEINSLSEHLCIFADALEENAPKIGDANVVNIMDKGADNTGEKNNLNRINATLAAMPSGGILYFPPGIYNMGGDLAMKSNKSIYLAGGASLRATSTTELRIIFSGANNAKLFGRGSIDGRGDSFRPKYNGEGGNTIFYCNAASDNCTIEGIVVKNAITWTSIVMYTKNWNVYNMKIINGRKFTNHDCWDPHDAVNMMLDNCFLYGTDDAIAYSVLSPNLDLNTTFRNSVFFNGHMGTTVRIGPWVGNNSKNITVENNDHLLGGNNDFTLSFYMGGSMSNLRYLNNRIENAQYGTIFIRTFWDDYYAGKKSGSLENLVFDRLYIEKPSRGWNGHYGRFEGENAANFVKDITFKDFYQKGVLQTSVSTADIEIVGQYVSNVQFTTSTTPVIDISATKLFAYRGEANDGKFTVSRTGGSTDNDLTVKYLIHGTAINGTDYSIIKDSVVIPAGLSEAEISITPDPTNTSDYYKTVLISLSSSKSSYLLGANFHATVTISNNNSTDIDNQLPTTPVNLDSSAVSATGFRLSWNSSTDNIGVATYQIFQNGVYLAATSDTSYLVTGLSSSQDYEFTVKAWDNSGNASPLSAALKIAALNTGISESYLNELSVYPNPVLNHKFFVDFGDADYGKEANIQIISIEGRVEFQAIIPISQKASINLPNSLACGIYVLNIKTSKESISHKIVVE